MIRDAHERKEALSTTDETEWLDLTAGRAWVGVELLSVTVVMKTAATVIPSFTIKLASEGKEIVGDLLSDGQPAKNVAGYSLGWTPDARPTFLTASERLGIETKDLTGGSADVHVRYLPILKSEGRHG